MELSYGKFCGLIGEGEEGAHPKSVFHLGRDEIHTKFSSRECDQVS